MSARDDIDAIVKQAQWYWKGSRQPITNPGLKRMLANPIDYSKPGWEDQLKAWQGGHDASAAQRPATAQWNGGFNFNQEALKILKPFRQRVGQHGADALSRQFYDQYKQMQANPDQYDDAKKRQMLAQWKKRIDQFEGRMAAKDRSASMTANRQAVVAPATQGSLGSGRSGPGVVSGGSAPVSTYRGPVSERHPDMTTGANGEKMYMTSSGKHVPLSKIPAYANLENRMKMSPKDRSAYYASNYGVAPRKPGVASPQVAKSDAGKGRTWNDYVGPMPFGAAR